VFIEGSYRNVFRRNVVAMSDQAIVLYDSSHENVFDGNVFVANFTPLWLVGRRTDTRFEGPIMATRTSTVTASRTAPTGCRMFSIISGET
jgi:parallel beta-helix repeat protein